MLALQGLTRIMERREAIDEVLNLIPEDKRTDAEALMGRLLGDVYAAGMNDGIELATDKPESRLRQVGLL